MGTVENRASNVIDFSPLAVKAPPTPSKWDVIPIHASDRAAFKFCRRSWAWSSPSKLNLIPRANVYGVIKPLWFGTGIHHALERYYNPAIREDPVIAFESWFNLQWSGGIVTEAEVKQFVDRSPAQLADGTYKVEGLCDILPDVDADEKFAELKDLGVGMLNYYKDYAAANDNFSVILVEHDFSVPVLNSKGEPLYKTDNRLMPDGWEPNFDEGNEFGPLMRKAPAPFGQSGFPDYYLEKQVHIRGRMDMVQQENEYGRFGILDYKTASKIGPDYFRHLELDEQCTSYLSFGELEARIYGLEHRQLEFITYQAMLKAYPKPPTPLKSGLPSISRTDESTTAAMFEKYIKDHGFEAIFNSDVKMQNYYTWLIETEATRFVHREDTWRNHMQRKNAMTRVYYEAQDMLNDPVAYPNPTKNYGCLNCSFRVPCIQAETGDDYMSTLEQGFISNWDR